LTTNATCGISSIAADSGPRVHTVLKLELIGVFAYKEPIEN